MLDIEKLKKEGLKLLDMHSHTIFSDGSQTLQESISFAKKNGIGICITDHNEIKGSLQIKKEIFTLYGSEITSSDFIDILVYFSKPEDLQKFYNKYILSNRIKEYGFKFHRTKLSTLELIEHADKFSALIVIPHPNTAHPKNSYKFFIKNSENKKLLNKIDAIEGLNCMMSPEANKNAISWAKELNIGLTASSDAHSLKYLGCGLTACYANNKEEFIEEIRNRRSMIYSKAINEPFRYLEALHIVWKNVKLS